MSALLKPTAEERAQFLHDHKAPADWVIFTMCEVRVLLEEIVDTHEELKAKDEEITKLQAQLYPAL